MSYFKSFSNSTGISTNDINTNSLTTSNINTSNLNVSGSVYFPVGSIPSNAINGSISTPDDDSMYALLDSGSSTQNFTGTHKFDNIKIGTSIDFSTSTISNLTKSNVGLNNVDNTTDANKPVSTATQTALNLKQNNLTSSTALLGLTLNNISLSNITNLPYLDTNISLFQTKYNYSKH